MLKLVNLLWIALLISLCLGCSRQSHASCEAKFVDLINDPCWSCIFPISIGGIVHLGPSDEIPDGGNTGGKVLCVCDDANGFPSLGVKVSFWEPFRLIDSVFDPGCFPGLGFEINVADGEAELHGTTTSGDNNPADNSKYYSAQAHYVIFNFWSYLEVLYDIPCLDSASIDVAYMTEYDPLWQDDYDTLMINPEALVFGNVTLKLACIADTLASAVDKPIDSLFWCIGNWADAYPLTGHIGTSLMPKGAAGTAARLLYKMGRELLLCDPAETDDGCGCERTPIWTKSHYKFQPIRPRVDSGENFVTGKPTVMWEWFQYDPVAPGHNNFTFILYRWNSCCVVYDY